jgi:hypothetical protein
LGAGRITPVFIELVGDRFELGDGGRVRGRLGAPVGEIQPPRRRAPDHQEGDEHRYYPCSSPRVGRLRYPELALVWNIPRRLERSWLVESLVAGGSSRGLRSRGG